MPKFRQRIYQCRPKLPLPMTIHVETARLCKYLDVVFQTTDMEMFGEKSGELAVLNVGGRILVVASQRGDGLHRKYGVCRCGMPNQH